MLHFFSYCIHYLAIAMITQSDQSNIYNRVFNWAYSSWVLESMMMKTGWQAAGTAAKRLHPDPQAGGKEHPGNGGSLLKPQVCLSDTSSSRTQFFPSKMPAL